MEGYLTEIRLFGPTWSPRNWASCSGQTMPISSFNAVFSLIGTLYGGDGRTTFNLPDLRGRTVVGAGAGIALTPRSNGQAGGVETVTLTTNNLPSHTHNASTSISSAGVGVAKTGPVDANSPAVGSLPGAGIADINGDPINYYTSTGTDITSSISGTATTIIDNNGSSQDHFNIQPYQVVLPIICLSGIYPSRN